MLDLVVYFDINHDSKIDYTFLRNLDLGFCSKNKFQLIVVAKMHLIPHELITKISEDRKE